MVLLHDVDKPGSDINEYLDSLDAILAHKVDIITKIRSRIGGFHKYLNQEKALSKQFYKERQLILKKYDAK